MKKYIQNLIYLARHKVYVIIAGIKLKTPILRLILHDVSKFLPDEFVAYSNHFYGNDSSLFTQAWLKHIHRNDHHWQYWILKNDDGHIEVMEMSDGATREMVADWYGAGLAINHEVCLKKWYNENRNKIILNKNTRIIVEKFIDCLQ